MDAGEIQEGAVYCARVVVVKVRGVQQGMYALFNASLGSGCDEQRVAVVQIHLLNARDDALRRTLVAGSVCKCMELILHSCRCCQPFPHVVQDQLLSIRKSNETLSPRV